eukprot:GHVU01078049.1.p1 GENE.GHVU01078049.1~~GHVU01078049.1.p1  ORF type:complete len:232 (+),score=35.62 GHVU01078049.1:564-1259(+)
MQLQAGETRNEAGATEDDAKAVNAKGVKSVGGREVRVITEIGAEKGEQEVEVRPKGIAQKMNEDEAPDLGEAQVKGSLLGMTILVSVTPDSKERLYHKFEKLESGGFIAWFATEPFRGETLATESHIIFPDILNHRIYTMKRIQNDGNGAFGMALEAEGAVEGKAVVELSGYWIVHRAPLKYVWKVDDDVTLEITNLRDVVVHEVGDFKNNTTRTFCLFSIAVSIFATLFM